MDQRALLKQMLAQRERPRPVRPLQRVDRTSALPASFAQERLWFVQQLESGSTAYNIAGHLRLVGPLKREALARAIEALIARHEVLRTTLHFGEDGAVQRIHDVATMGPPLPFEDLRSLEQSERQRRTEALLGETRAHAFDAALEAPLRLRLLQVADDEHLLALTIHHAAMDGWSRGIFSRELGALYEAFANGAQPQLPDLPIQYADFATWQRAQWTEDALAPQLEWWRKQLDGVSHALNLPTDKPRPAVQRMEGKLSREHPFPPHLWERVKTFARERSVTPFVVLEAAFHALLHRLSGDRDIAVGTPVMGRPRPELERLIGLFVNEVVLRVDLGGDPSFEELVPRVRRAVLDAFARQEVPFDKLVKALNPERDPSRAPLFQVVFSYEQPPAPFTAAGVTFTPVPAPVGTGRCDLALMLAEGPESISACIDFNSDLFEAETIERMLERYRLLVDALLEEPGRALSSIPLLTPDEQLFVQQHCAGPLRQHDVATLHELVARTTARHPEAVAVQMGGVSLSYAQLELEAERCARKLRAFGIKPEERVGVLLERGPEYLVALLGILRAGGSFVPLDPALPTARLEWMVRDAGARKVITTAALTPLLGSEVERALFLEGAATSTGAPGAADARNLAYVIYTSGSTGQPKGVAVEHRSAVNTILEAARDLDLRVGDRTLQFVAPGFDASIQEIFSVLAAGATLVLATRESLLPGPGLTALLARQRISVLTLPTPVLAALPVTQLPDLRVINVGGEACSAELLDAWSGGRRFIQQYGPTEATITATSELCRSGAGRPGIGRPYANVRVYVVDQALQPVPPGMPGELCIAGVGVARGYLGRPELTAERFVPDPFAEEAGARMYRTGDRVRMRADGSLEFLGRADNQVKLRGFRIEPGEIEARLHAFPQLAAAAVVVREERLVAYVVTRPGESVDAAAVRSSLQRDLPEYMVPGVFVVLDRLPLTPNGKVDLRALPPPPAIAADDGAAPTAIEAMVASVWSEVLGLSHVPLRANFFELGGHSLLGARIVARLSESFSVDVSLRTLFDHPTVAGLAEQLEAVLPRVDVSAHSDDEVERLLRELLAKEQG